MRKISFFFLNALLCVGLLTMTSCTPTGSEPSSSESTESARASRPVTKRLCSLVIIGNLGNVEFDMAMSGFATESPVYSAMTPSLEKREKSVMSSLLDLDNEETEAELNELIRQRRKLLETELPTPSNAPELNFPSRSMSTTTPDGGDETDQIEAPPAGSELILPSLPREGMMSDSPAPSPLGPAAGEAAEMTLGDIPEGEFDEFDDKYIPEEAVTELLSRSIKKTIGETVKVEDEAPKNPVAAAQILTEEELNSVRDEHVKKFLEINKKVPENVLKEISDNNFQNYSIWFGQSNTGVFYAVRYFEYVGAEFDFEKDYFMLYTSPGYKAWMEQQQDYLRPTGSNSIMSLDVWLEMKEMFHTTSL